MAVRGWPNARLLKGGAWTTLLWTYVMVIAWLGKVGKAPDNNIHQAVCRPDMEVHALPPLPEDDVDMLKQLFTYLTKPHPSACHKKAILGGSPALILRTREQTVDGQKLVCMDPEFTILTSDRCLVYSFGISTDWAFDWDMERLGCVVHSFDPSIDLTSSYQNGTITFLQYGIGGRDHVNERGWEIRTLDTFIKYWDHQDRTIHYLKMDVEAAEFEVLRQQVLLGDKSPLVQNVEQLGIELHFTSRLPVAAHVPFYRETYKTFLAMQGMGYYPFHYERNTIAEVDMDVPGLNEKLVSAMEVAWLKTKCVIQDT